MRKHIKRKFIMQYELPDNFFDEVEMGPPTTGTEDIYEKHDIPKESVPFLIYEGNVLLKAFTYRYGKEIRFVPEPDPVLVYINTAYINFKSIEPTKKKILNILATNDISEDISEQLYNYFGHTSSCIILLHAALEAFVNKSIPVDYEYKRVMDKKTEIYNKQQIEATMPLLDKINLVLNVHFKKDFRKEFPISYDKITNLKDFRNKLVHIQQSSYDGEYYSQLYTRALDFEYESTMDAVVEICNFYSLTPNYIEDCPCSNPS